MSGELVVTDTARYLAEVYASLISRCGDNSADERIASARRAFEERRGPVFEDEELWETSSRAFLEWYALEETSGSELLVETAVREAQEERERAALLAWQRSYRCLGEIAALHEGHVLLVDLIGDAHIPVTERRGLPGVKVGDIAECRIVTFEGEVHFGGWFLWHPQGTRAPLLAHVKAMTERGDDRGAILDFAASLRVRSLRYSHVPPPKVYEQVHP